MSSAPCKESQAQKAQTKGISNMCEEEGCICVASIKNLEWTSSKTDSGCKLQKKNRFKWPLSIPKHNAPHYLLGQSKDFLLWDLVTRDRSKAQCDYATAEHLFKPGSPTHTHTNTDTHSLSPSSPSGPAWGHPQSLSRWRRSQRRWEHWPCPRTTHRPASRSKCHLGNSEEFQNPLNPLKPQTAYRYKKSNIIIIISMSE